MAEIPHSRKYNKDALQTVNRDASDNTHKCDFVTFNVSNANLGKCTLDPCDTSFTCNVDDMSAFDVNGSVTINNHDNVTISADNGDTCISKNNANLHKKRVANNRNNYSSNTSSCGECLKKVSICVKSSVTCSQCSIDFHLDCTDIREF